jgi:predicted exporter
MENRGLQRETLDGTAREQYLAQLGLAATPQMADDGAPPLTLDKVLASDGPLKFLELLVLDSSPGATTHVVTLDGVLKPAAVATVADGLPGVRYIDPANDFSALLGKYRGRAIILLGASLLLMLPLLIWRYGLRGALWVVLPSLLAVLLTPLLRAVVGGSFTFFDAMALILVLSVGIDYGVFIAETTADRRAVTLLAVALAACTTLLSFGLLALSGVLAVHNFGLTMLIGVLLASALSPLAYAAAKHRSC